jgi:hypothetical protein
MNHECTKQKKNTETNHSILSSRVHPFVRFGRVIIRLTVCRREKKEREEERKRIA